MFIIDDNFAIEAIPLTAYTLEGKAESIVGLGSLINRVKIGVSLFRLGRPSFVQPLVFTVNRIM